MIAAALIILAGSLWLISIFRSLPPPILMEERKVAESTRIYDRSGEVLLYEVHGDERRTIVPFEEIPEAVKQSTIAAEDANFYRHPAFDWKSIIRAGITDVLRREFAQGGSTITQQLAKNAFLSGERTFARKVRELILALQLERRFSKDEILNSYLNQIPYGADAYGIEAASQTYFGKTVGALSLPESAILSALIKAPSYYSPWGSNTEALFARKDRIIGQMVDLGFISEEEGEEAKRKKITFTKPSRGIKAPHFVMSVINYLNQRYGEELVRKGGLTIVTTLDWELQELAERAVSEGALRNEESYGGKNAALVAENPATGEILAHVGSRNYFDIENDGNFDVATQGLRQPGSAIKPFVYVTAFSEGYTPETIVFDLETEFSTDPRPEKSYKPSNYDGAFRGPITLRRALAQSVNVPAVKVLYLVGLGDALITAEKFGFKTLTERSRYGLSLVLGGGEVRLVDLVSAYSTFARDGERHEQAIILKVSNREKVFEAYADESRRAMDAQYVRMINDILSDREARVPIFGSTLDLPRFPDHQVAVKTGTSNDYRDAWAVGYTPSLVVGVWAGNNDNAPMRGGESVRAAAPIWREFMNEVLARRAPESFPAYEETLVAEKPMLRGEYVVNYESEGKTYPQIHDLLFYVNKNDPQGEEPKNPDLDPQFKNWETSVSKWIETHVPNPDRVNQPLPPGSKLLGTGVVAFTPGVTISLTKPLNGAFVEGSFPIEAEIVSGSNLKRVEVSWNGNVLEVKDANLGSSFSYQATLRPAAIELQNIFSITALDEEGKSQREEKILFKQL